MGLRQTLNENPVVTSVIVGVLTLGALFLVGRQACSGGTGTEGTAFATKAFFTVDEGKTRFVDDANKIPPFQKDGKPALRAVVFKCADGTEFVNHLERYPEKMHAELEKAGGPSRSMQGAMSKEIKRPGDKAWVTMRDPARFSKVSQPKCPKDGSTTGVVGVDPL